MAELLLEIGDQGRLARTDLAGDDDKALALLQAERKVGHGPPVRPPGVEEPWIGAQLEGPAGQPVIVGIHRPSSEALYQASKYRVRRQIAAARVSHLTVEVVSQLYLSVRCQPVAPRVESAAHRR